MRLEGVQLNFEGTGSFLLEGPVYSQPKPHGSCVIKQGGSFQPARDDPAFPSDTRFLMHASPPALEPLNLVLARTV